MRWIGISFITLVVLSLIGAAILKGFWYPGITKKQTAVILLDDQKLGFRAFNKAKRHGVSIINEISLLTNDFVNIDSHQAEMISRLLNDIDTYSIVDYGKKLYGQDKLYPKLMGALILSKSKEKLNYENMFQFLTDVATRNHPKLEKDLYRSHDYYDEIAILAVGNYGGDQAFQLLSKILNEVQVPYVRHAVASGALARLGDQRAIDVLHNRMLDEEFKATLPAFEALLEVSIPRQSRGL